MRDHSQDVQDGAGTASVGDTSIGTNAIPESETLDASSNTQGEDVSQQEQDIMLYDEEPDEDRLIAQGGIGIPIGPVRMTLSSAFT